ncbi:MAG: hypothetical protein ACREIF_04045 [Chthoniobacterales bacterium]
MNLSFLRFFKKARTPEAAVTVVSRPIVAIEKPASERFGKTVLPNVTRVVGAESTVDFNPPAGLAASPAISSVMTAPLSATSPSLGTATLVPPAPRKISLGRGGNFSTVPKSLASESPSPARTIALQLADVATQISAGLLKPGQIDPFHRLVLKASELERGMSSGRPTVPLRAIYQQAPQLFVSEVDPADKTEVTLPFAKVLEQFAAFQVRPDQVAEQALPQVETPFLQVTLEDSKRFGTPAAPVPAPVPEPALEPVAEIQPTGPIRLPVPKEAVAAAPPPGFKGPPARPPIPAKISPNGTGGPATERVPASSGSPVPTLSPPPSAPLPLARIPFKISPPSDDLRQPAAPKIASPHPQSAKLPLAGAGSRISLSLRSILRSLAPFQLSGPIDKIAESAMIELPFSILESQLSLGRVSISPAQFQAALTEEYRGILKIDDMETPIVLPLQEVLQNLPNESLQLRPDQEETEVVSLFETPFSKKAAEDATRLKNFSGPIAKPADSAAAAADHVAIAAPGIKPPWDSSKPGASSQAGSPLAPAIAGLAARNALQVAFDTDETLDAKSVVAHASCLPGVSSCAIVFSDGLSLAGNIPADFGVDALCAIAPAIMKKIGEQMAGANLGALAGVTLFCAKAAVTFFAHGNICLAALHKTGEEIAPEIRDRLNQVAEELARTYAQPS